MDTSPARTLLRAVSAAVAPTLVSGLVVGLLLAPSACADDPVAPEEDDPQPRIFFVTDREDSTTTEGFLRNRDIYRIGLDGTGPENLTNAPASVYRHLEVSPDGTRLLFESDRTPGCYNVWVLWLDGGNVEQLTGLNPGERCNTFPRWSPDGSKIAFSTSRYPLTPDGLGWEAWVMNADGSDPHGVSNIEGWDRAHVWTPDVRVVFHGWKSQGVQTWVVDADGSGLEPLLDEGDWGPYWSPDGTRVAFVSERDGNSEIYLMGADGTGATNLTVDPGFDAFHPWQKFEDPWSPDGTRLVFTSDRDRAGGSDLFVMNADGTGVKSLTGAAGNDVFNGWSPDGSRILFSSDRSGNWDVYVINADGTGLVNVTQNPADDRHGTWVPGS